MTSAWRERRGSRYRVRYREGESRGPKTAGTFASAMEADQEIDRIESALRLSPKYPGQLMGIADIVRAYVTARQQDGSMAAGNALSCEAAVVRHAEGQGWRTVLDVTPAAIVAWRNGAKTIGAWRHLRAVLRWSSVYLNQPVDSRLMVRMPSPRRRRRAEAPLIPDKLVREALKRSRPHPHVHAMLHWLATYGPRPISLLHLTVGGVDLARSCVKILHNKNGTPYEHALLPATVALLRPLMKGRDPGERLFLDPRTNAPWEFSPTGTADRFGQWYRVWISHDFPVAYRGPYVLKDWAISKLAQRGIDDADVIAFTGHADKATLAFYRKTNLARSRKQLHRLPRL